MEKPPQDPHIPPVIGRRIPPPPMPVDPRYGPSGKRPLSVGALIAIIIVIVCGVGLLAFFGFIIYVFGTCMGAFSP